MNTEPSHTPPPTLSGPPAAQLPAAQPSAAQPPADLPPAAHPAAPAPPGLPTPTPERTARLRAALRAASFTPDGLRARLGEPGYAALQRNEIVPALRETRSAGPLETLVRLFLLRRQVPAPQAENALPLDDALADGWLTRDGDRVAATVDVRPYQGPEGADWWIVSDLGCATGGAGGARQAAGANSGGLGADLGGSGANPGGQAVPPAAGAELVFGVGGASATLAGITVRTPVRRALDLGSGCGVQALHASRHADRVTATDLNPRALALTRLTLGLSGAAEPDLRQGSLFAPVRGETFDLIVSNPPFVISPPEPRPAPDAPEPSPSSATGGRLVYRDGGMAGDALCRTLVQQAADHLTDGGHLQMLANWQHVRGEDWRDRLAAWVPPGCDAWIVQREVQDVARYAELWLRDAGDHLAGAEDYEARYDAWLDEFEALDTTAVGFGWIALRRSGAAAPSVRVEDWPHPVEQPLGEAVAAHFRRQDFLRGTDDAALLGTHFRLVEGVVQEQFGAPGAEDPEYVVLRQDRGMRRATRVDSVTAGFAGVCDGSLAAGRVLDAIAQVVDEDPAEVRARALEPVRLLVDQGFLEPVPAG